MQTRLAEGETLVRDGSANLQRGIETVGGRLYLTDQRLIFESHSFNVQTGATEISLADIRIVKKCWTRFLNLIPVAPNSMAVITKDDSENRFVILGRAGWMDSINEQIQKI